MSMIELKDIGKIYGKGDAKTEALKHINWTVEEGEFWSIVGPSGSGKTTLLNVLGVRINLQVVNTSWEEKEWTLFLKKN